MTPKNFTRLLDSIKLYWTSSKGIVVELRRIPDSEEPVLILTAGTEDNGKFTASRCKLWHKEDLLFAGPLTDSKLKKRLGTYRVCHAQFRTSNSAIDSKDWKSKRMCLGDPTTCNKKCPMSTYVSEDAESDTVSSAGEAVSEGGNSQ